LRGRQDQLALKGRKEMTVPPDFLGLMDNRVPPARRAQLALQALREQEARRAYRDLKERGAIPGYRDKLGHQVRKARQDLRVRQARTVCRGR
jgi:hypothetical protein